MQTNTGPTSTSPGHWVITEFGGPEVLEWQPLDPRIKSVPPPANSALVRILVAGIGGTDNLQRAGGYPSPRCAQPGFTLGCDIVGEIVSVGSVTTPAADSRHNYNPGCLRAGNLVASMCVTGGYATHAMLPLDELLKLPLPPPSVDTLLHLAVLPLNYTTAHGMLHRAAGEGRLRPGDAILVGSVAGGVGTAVAQLARAPDLRLAVYGTCSPGQFAYVLGAEPVDRTAGHAVADTVRRLTGGRAGAAWRWRATRSAAQRAWARVISRRRLRSTARTRVTVTSPPWSPSGPWPASTRRARGCCSPPARACWRTWPGVCRRAPSSGGVEAHYFRVARDEFMRDLRGLVDLVVQGRLEPVVSRVFALRDAVQVIRILVEGSTTGKMLFVVDAAMARTKGIV